MTTLTTASPGSGNSQLERRVDGALRQSAHLNRHRISLETHDGCVVLKGIVKSYFQKQVAQEVIRRIDGVNKVDNRLEVRWATPSELV